MSLIHHVMHIAFFRDHQDPDDATIKFSRRCRYEIMFANSEFYDRFKSLMTEEEAFFTDCRSAVRVSRYAFPAVLKEDHDGIRLARDNFHAMIANEPFVVSSKKHYGDIHAAAGDQDQIKLLWDVFLARY